MPWWGWLIAGGVVFLGLIWLIVVLAGLRAFRRTSDNILGSPTRTTPRPNEWKVNRWS